MYDVRKLIAYKVKHLLSGNGAGALIVDGGKESALTADANAWLDYQSAKRSKWMAWRGTPHDKATRRSACIMAAGPQR